MTSYNIDYAQLQAWREYRLAQQRRRQWRVRICAQVQKNSRQLQDVLVDALTPEDAQRIAVQRYLRDFPRRVNSTWVECVEVA